jgi:hypothetical protein
MNPAEATFREPDDVEDHLQYHVVRNMSALSSLIYEEKMKLLIIKLDFTN